MKVLLSPSLLSANLSDLKGAIKIIEDKKAAAVHIDVMDGVFVPEISYGEPVIRSIRALTSLPFDVHLMTTCPERQALSFIEAGATWLTFHTEACIHSYRLLTFIKSHNVKAGISIVPATPVSSIRLLLEVADIVLVMGVNPGFAGQALINSSIDKVKELVNIRKERGYNYLISIDGGVNKETLPSLVEAGTDIVVSGSAFFNGSLLG